MQTEHDVDPVGRRLLRRAVKCGIGPARGGEWVECKELPGFVSLSPRDFTAPFVRLVECGGRACLLTAAARVAPAAAELMLELGAELASAPCRGAGVLRAAIKPSGAYSLERRRLVSRLAATPGLDLDGCGEDVICLAGRLVFSTPLANAVSAAQTCREFGPLRALLRAGALMTVVPYGEPPRDAAEFLAQVGSRDRAVGMLAAEGAERRRWGPLRRAWVAAVVGPRPSSHN